jgi:Putative holin
VARRAGNRIHRLRGVIVEDVIPVPRAWMLASAMLVGTAVGLLGGIAAIKLVDVPVRPDLVIALVVGVPSAVGLVLIMASHRRWMTALGAFVLAIAPAWFAALATIQVVHGA